MKHAHQNVVSGAGAFAGDRCEHILHTSYALPRRSIWQHVLERNQRMQIEGPVACPFGFYELTKQRDHVHVLQPEAGGRVT